MMETIYSDGKTLEIERMLKITVFLPQPCHFCGEEITKLYGRESESLCFHSLDGNHDNWDPSNKVPSHYGCHSSFHWKGDKNPTYGKPNYWGHHTDDAKRRIGDSKRGKKRDPDIFQRGVATARARYGKAMCPPKAAKEKSERMRKNNPQKNHDTVMKGVKTRFERHGPSGCRDNELRKKRIGDANRGNSQIGIKGRQTRRELYGSSGYSKEGLEKIRKRMSGDENPMKRPGVTAKIWKKRRELYGPSGMKPKSQVVV